MYVGPQSWTELHALGNDLENVNPYAGWLHPVVQPFATIMMRVLLWMKATLRVNYGWVLIIFGVAIRLPALAAEQQGDAVEHPDAAAAAGADRDPDEVQERSGEAARSA